MKLESKTYDADPNVFQLILDLLSISGSLASLVSIATWYLKKDKSPELRVSMESHCAEVLEGLIELEHAIAQLKDYLENIHFNLEAKVRIKTSIFVANLGQFVVYKQISKRLRRIRNEVEKIFDQYEQLVFLKELAGGGKGESFSYFESLGIDKLEKIVSGLTEFKFADLLNELDSFRAELEQSTKILLERLRSEG